MKSAADFSFQSPTQSRDTVTHRCQPSQTAFKFHCRRTFSTAPRDVLLELSEEVDVCIVWHSNNVATLAIDEHITEALIDVPLCSIS